jgi:hypothetical protein
MPNDTEYVTTEINGVHHALYIHPAGSDAHPVSVGDLLTSTEGEEFQVTGPDPLDPACILGFWNAGSSLEPKSTRLGNFARVVYVSENA